jgi:cytochrome c biogenesis protein CcmG, thiol:disulfide interchange protein DsbE
MLFKPFWRHQLIARISMLHCKVNGAKMEAPVNLFLLFSNAVSFHHTNLIRWSITQKGSDLRHSFNGFSGNCCSYVRMNNQNADAERSGLAPMLDRRLVLVGLPSLLLSGCNPSVAIVPDLARPALPGLVSGNGWAVPGFKQGLFRNRVTVLNVWASWCGYCRGEHSLLMGLDQKLGLPLYGLVYMDKAEAGAAYLKQAGNPFTAVAHDPDGKLAKGIGQRGVPSTYVIGHDGSVVAKWGGGLDAETINRVLRPSVAEARKRQLAALKAA